MVIERILAGVPGVDPAGVAAPKVGAETGGGVSAGSAAGGSAGGQVGAGACSVGRAGRAAAALEAALGLRMTSISSALAPAWLSRIISAVERSNLLFFDDLTWLTITGLGTLACSMSSTPWLVSSESAGGGTAALSGKAGTAVSGVAGAHVSWTGAGVWSAWVTGTGADTITRCFHHQPPAAAAHSTKTPATASARALSGFFFGSAAVAARLGTAE